MKNTQELINYLQVGHQVRYLHFWGHKQKGKVIDKSCLSQWFPASFVINKKIYSSAEHYMMIEKASLFDDMESVAKIFAVNSPAEAKKLGRKVKNFDAKRWSRYSIDAVIAGNIAKFGQNPELKAFLINTADAVLVEASPRDRIWGIGMGVNNENAYQPANWRGRNLLGFALMQARKELN
ncbi:MAG: NADAR family protein [Cocleimonas sp.]|nr:NADAR family protein [Cocleimonas sp.]